MVIKYKANENWVYLESKRPAIFRGNMANNDKYMQVLGQTKVAKDSEEYLQNVAILNDKFLNYLFETTGFNGEIKETFKGNLTDLIEFVFVMVDDETAFVINTPAFLMTDKGDTVEKLF